MEKRYENSSFWTASMSFLLVLERKVTEHVENARIRGFLRKENSSQDLFSSVVLEVFNVFRDWDIDNTNISTEEQEKVLLLWFSLIFKCFTYFSENLKASSLASFILNSRISSTLLDLFNELMRWVFCEKLTISYSASKSVASILVFLLRANRDSTTDSFSLLYPSRTIVNILLVKLFTSSVDNQCIGVLHIFNVLGELCSLFLKDNLEENSFRVNSKVLSMEGFIPSVTFEQIFCRYALYNDPPSNVAIQFLYFVKEILSVDGSRISTVISHMELLEAIISSATHSVEKRENTLEIAELHVQECLKVIMICLNGVQSTCQLRLCWNSLNSAFRFALSRFRLRSEAPNSIEQCSMAIICEKNTWRLCFLSLLKLLVAFFSCFFGNLNRSSDTQRDAILLSEELAFGLQRFWEQYRGNAILISFCRGDSRLIESFSNVCVQ